MILFLAANPSTTDRLALDREARAVHVELKRSGYRDRFDFVTRWAVEPLDLLREMRELKPTVVHFSGHGRVRRGETRRPTHRRDVVVDETMSGGDRNGLCFQSAAEDGQLVSSEAIAQTLEAAGPSVRLVVLNACYTALIADALVAHVDCVVGMNGSIHDDAARTFAIGFYGGLGEHESVTAAFKQGKAAIELDGLPDAEQPQLKVRSGFDASHLILAAAAPLLRRELPCPYPGMRPYTADDAASFHGRDAEIEDLIGRLRAGEREIYVIGPSGSGKSSLVSAGTLPRLARGVAGLGPLVVRTMRPGEQPSTRLSGALDSSPVQPFMTADAIAALLAHRSRDSSVLLVVDQLEELFTLTNGIERDAFLAALRRLRTERRCAVIFTLRADFFGALMESPLWPERSRDQLSLVKVSTLRGQALREAITIPAHDAGVAVEPDLIERLLADTASEPGILPLLQETMIQLWEKRADQTLTLGDYQALGDGNRSGLAVAVARRAEAALRMFTPAQIEVARRILLRLISFGEGRTDTRRQQFRAQLSTASDDGDDFALVLQTMVDHRLLTMDEDGHSGEPLVDLAHEVMIAAWGTLAGWIRNHRLDEQKRRQLEAAAIQWVVHGCGIRGLLDPIELADAEAWEHTESARQLGHSAEVRALIAASREEHTKRENEARVQARKLEASERSSRRLLAQMYAESGRQLLLEGRYQESIPYFLAARQSGLDDPPLRMMFEAAKRYLPLIPALEHQRAIVSAAFSRDGTRVVTASKDNTARVWHAATGEAVTPTLEHQQEVVSAAFSPDGTRVVTASEDNTARVWHAVTGNLLVDSLTHRGAVTSAAFSPDGTRVVTASKDNTARVWSAITGEPLTDPLEHQAAVWSAAFSPDGTRIVTASGDKTARLWDVATGTLVTSPLNHEGWVRSAEFSPDGTRVVTASGDCTARLWDATTGKPLTGPLAHVYEVKSATFSPDGTRVVTVSLIAARVWRAATGEAFIPAFEHQKAVRSASFSPDGTRVVTASEDKTVRVWNAVTGGPLSSPLQHQQGVVSASFSPDGERVVTASEDNAARVWGAATRGPLVGTLRHQDKVMSAKFSHDGTRVVTASADRTARVWNVATGSELLLSLEHQAEVVSAAFSPDGTRVLTASRDCTARLWDADTGTPVVRPLVHRGPLASAVFSPDGTYVVTASRDNTARVWDTDTGKPVTGPLEHQRRVLSVAFSPDGTRVVTASEDKAARLWDTSTGQLLTSPLEHRAAVENAAFSPNGALLVTASGDNTAQVWDAITGKLLASLFGHHDFVVSAEFSSDSARVVTASCDNTALVWNAQTGKPLTGPLEHNGRVLCAAFSPDGTRVITASEDKTARVWDAASGKPLMNPFQHKGTVATAAFNFEGNYAVTASSDGTAQVWDLRVNTETLEQWAAISERSSFVLNGIALVRRSPPQQSTNNLFVIRDPMRTDSVGFATKTPWHDGMKTARYRGLSAFNDQGLPPFDDRGTWIAETATPKGPGARGSEGTPATAITRAARAIQRLFGRHQPK